MNDNGSKIVTFKGKPLTEEEAQQIAAKRRPPSRAETTATIPETVKDGELSVLANATRMVKEDVLEGVIVVGRKKGSQVFHTNHALHQNTVPPEELWAFVGVLHGLAMELTDIANSRAKELLEDGTISEPDELEEIAE